MNPTPIHTTYTAYICCAFTSLFLILAGCGDTSNEEDTTPSTSNAQTTSAQTTANNTSPQTTTTTGTNSSTSETSTSETSTSGTSTNPPPFSCDGPTHDREDRLLGLDLLNTAQVENFSTNLDHAEDLGVNFIALHVLWDQIETAPQSYTDPFGAIQALHNVAVDEDMKFSLTIRPIDLSGKTVPDDLEGTRFNDPHMIERFKDLLDYVFTLVSADNLTSIQIGNEIDGFNASGEHPEFWSDYGAFLFEMVQHLHTTQPNLKVGFTVTYHGATQGALAASGVFDAYADFVDVVGVTYYPIDNGFKVLPPEHATQAFDEIAALYGDTPIYLQEVGYQTSDISESTQEDQATFFCNVFRAWDTHREKIRALNIVRLFDVSHEMAEEMALPYGIGAEPFTEYLRTLGIRTWEGNGDAKPAFDLIQTEAEKRGW